MTIPTPADYLPRLLIAQYLVTLPTLTDQAVQTPLLGKSGRLELEGFNRTTGAQQVVLYGPNGNPLLVDGSNNLQTTHADVSAGGDLAALNATLAVNLNGQATVLANIGGTWAGTITFQGSIDGTNWVNINALPLPNGAASPTTTAVGQWVLPTAGYDSVRVAMTAYTSGTATITLRGSVGYHGNNLDAAGNAMVSQGTAIAGEDLTHNVMRVEGQFQYATITTATTTMIKSGAGLLAVFNVLGGTLGAITGYDNTAGSGTAIIPTFTPSGQISLDVSQEFSNGLTIVTTAATVINLGYR